MNRVMTPDEMESLYADGIRRSRMTPLLRRARAPTIVPRGLLPKIVPSILVLRAPRRRTGHSTHDLLLLMNVTVRPARLKIDSSRRSRSTTDPLPLIVHRDRSMSDVRRYRTGKAARCLPLPLTTVGLPIHCLLLLLLQLLQV